MDHSLKHFKHSGIEFNAVKFSEYIDLSYRPVDSPPDPFGFGIRTWHFGKRLPVDATDADIRHAAIQLSTEASS